MTIVIPTPTAVAEPERLHRVRVARAPADEFSTRLQEALRQGASVRAPTVAEPGRGRAGPWQTPLLAVMVEPAPATLAEGNTPWVAPDLEPAEAEEPAVLTASQAPTVQVTTAGAPTAKAPTAVALTIEAPITQAPIDEAPIDEAPTTEALTTEAPNTQSPTVQSPTVQSPTVQSPPPPAPTNPTHLPARIELPMTPMLPAHGPYRLPTTTSEAESPPAPPVAFAIPAEVPAPITAPRIAEPALQSRFSPPTPQPQDLVTQAASFIRVLQSSGRSEARFQLHPEHLGAISIKLIVQEGLVRATMLVHEPAARLLLEANTDQLRSRLADQGLYLEQVAVYSETPSGHSHQPHSGAERPSEPTSHGGEEVEVEIIHVVASGSGSPWRIGGRLDSLA